MKRGLALTLLVLTTSMVVSGQIRGVPPSVTSLGPGRGPNPGVPASVTSLGPLGFGDNFFDGRFSGGFTFGHHPQFITSFRNFHPHFFPVVVPYYWPSYPLDYPVEGYDTNSYQQPTQPVVVVMDTQSSDDRYGEHLSERRRSPAQPAEAQAPPAPVREQEPTVLVFRDGRQQEVRNYAIVGQTLWDFSGQGTHKISLSDLDLERTRKLNDERGIEFVLPQDLDLSKILQFPDGAARPLRKRIP